MKWRLDDGQIEVVDEAVAEALRRKTPGERMLMTFQAWEFARVWVRAAVKSQHPEWDERAVQAEVRRRLSGGAA
jgi:hypothetical protein